MTFPKAHVIRFFQLLTNRQFIEAQRELQRIMAKTPNSNWNIGYCLALKGMLLAQKDNGNQYTYLQNIDYGNTPAMKKARNEFKKHVTSRFLGASDRGFFSAWSDYLLLLIRASEETEASKTVEGQATILQYTELTKKPLSH